jgi:hypothetical protein
MIGQPFRQETGLDQIPGFVCLDLVTVQSFAPPPGQPVMEGPPAIRVLKAYQVSELHNLLVIRGLMENGNGP